MPGNNASEKIAATQECTSLADRCRKQRETNQYRGLVGKGTGKSRTRIIRGSTSRRNESIEKWSKSAGMSLNSMERP